MVTYWKYVILITYFQYVTIAIQRNEKQIM